MAIHNSFKLLVASTPDSMAYAQYSLHRQVRQRERTILKHSWTNVFQVHHTEPP
jgi:hypothetical protein